MKKESRTKEENETETRKISKALCDILDEMKEIINEFGWGQLRISDAEASRVLAIKIRQANLINKDVTINSHS